MLKKIRAIVVVGASWAAVWATTGFALNAWRFLLHSHQLGLDRSLSNLWPWVRIGIDFGGSFGFVVGATFGVMLAVLPPLTGARISRRWSVGYGIASGVAASLYILHVGYTAAMIPTFATLFSMTGAVTALAMATIADREPVPALHEEVVA